VGTRREGPGSLWGVIKLYDSPVKDNQWFTVHIIVKVNGKIVIDYTEPEGTTAARRIGKGYFALQQHAPIPAAPSIFATSW
jgi:hypothetical protein